MGRQKTVGLLLAAAALTAGCISVSRPRFAPVVYNADVMESLGAAHGSVSRHYILGVGPMENDETLANAAVDEAVRPLHGDALVNVVSDDRTSCGILPIVCVRTLTISGLAVRYKTTAPRKMPGD